MDPTAAAIVSGMLGLVTGAIAVASLRRGQRSPHPAPTPADSGDLPAGVSAVLAVLQSGAIALDAADTVVSTSPSAVPLGLVRDRDLVHEELRHLARQVRRDGVIREVELDLRRGPLGLGRMMVGARVAPLGSAYVLLLVTDRTEVRRVEDVRRDFVVNVSHELKTPVGGLALLAEAVLEAKDDPEAVARFAHRMQVESTRLTRLVQEIVDLSRLEFAGTLHEPELVDVATAAGEAIEQSRVVAGSQGAEIVSSFGQGGHVFGDADLLATAIRNLIGNAINYSAPGARVAVSVRTVDRLVEIAVADQGQGIHESEQARIFERFYRVDAARSRATGGTGLGLAIVKHICANHGGDVTVWSEPGHGSTFTMRLPAAPGGPAALGGPASRGGPAVRNGPAARNGPEVARGPAARGSPAVRSGPAARGGPATRSGPEVARGPVARGRPAVRSGPDVAHGPAASAGPEVAGSHAGNGKAAGIRPASSQARTPEHRTREVSL